MSDKKSRSKRQRNKTCATAPSAQLPLVFTPEEFAARRERLAEARALEQAWHAQAVAAIREGVAFAHEVEKLEAELAAAAPPDNVIDLITAAGALLAKEPRARRDAPADVIVFRTRTVRR